MERLKRRNFTPSPFVAPNAQLERDRVTLGGQSVKDSP